MKRKIEQLSLLNNERVTTGLPILNSFADIAWQWPDSIAHLTTAATQINKTQELRDWRFLVLGCIVLILVSTFFFINDDAQKTDLQPQATLPEKLTFKKSDLQVQAALPENVLLIG
ncbi:MAG: hypothetical protein PHD43_14720 [Methylococcales bacterium]|nr:hypothetical protein [Methylococcales bacterium]